MENLPPGRYKLRMELSGFATAEMADIELLVGTNATVPPIAMKLAALQETITVTSAGTARQHHLVAGVREHRSPPDGGTAAAGAQLDGAGHDGQRRHGQQPTNTPGAADDQFQLNLDGQQITQRVAGSGFGQPKVSREAIAEFQIVTNMFDITQGRSTGMQVQAISRSGTNDLRGSTYGYFRSDRFNAADPVTGTVLPFENQQAGVTLGGPIIQNKMHFFGSYEHERQPADSFLAPTRLPHETFQFQTKPTNDNYLGRVDYQQSAANSFTFRGQRWAFNNPFSISSGTAHPSTADKLQSYSIQLRRYLDACRQLEPPACRFRAGSTASPGTTMRSRRWTCRFTARRSSCPEFDFPGLTIGGASNYPNDTWQNTLSARTDVTWHLGRHETKFGGEFLRVHDTKVWSLNRRGIYTFSTRPSDAELERRFPASAWNNPVAWDISGLEPYLQNFTSISTPTT